MSKKRQDSVAPSLRRKSIMARIFRIGASGF